MDSQTKLIENAILEEITKDIHTNKNQIISAVVDELDVPRPTVRRVKANMVKKMKQRVKILE